MARSILLAIAAFVSVSAASAESAQDRVMELKQWKADCAEEDADLRVAYIEAALATKDPAIIRICNRLALQSDNADVRNLGLRAAISSLDQILFQPTMPEGLSEIIEKAKTDSDFRYEIGQCRADMAMAYAQWNKISNGIRFKIEGATVRDSTSTWQSLINVDSPSNRYSGDAVVIGDAVSWNGQAYNIHHCSGSTSVCNLSANLTDSGKLAGTFKCVGGPPFEVEAALQ